MSDLRSIAAMTPQRLTADGGYINHQALRDGSLRVSDLIDNLAMEGRVFGANVGSVTTPVTFLITAANRPDAWIRVPSGTTIIPTLVSVALESMAGTATEIDIRIAQNDIGNGTSTAADVGPISLRTDAPVTSNCTARKLATGDTTAETNPMTLLRKSYIRADDAGSDEKGLVWTHREFVAPILVGPASLEVFVSATTTQATGFVVIQWAEVPSNFLT